MDFIFRGLRNVTRNKGRSLLVIFIAGLSVGVFLTMLQTSQVIGEKVNELSRETATTIEIRPVDSPMSLVTDADAPIPSERLDQVLLLPNVAKHERYVRIRIDEKNAPATLNKIIVTGLAPGTSLRVATHGQFVVTNIIDGQGVFNESQIDERVAIVGEIFAENHGLKVGDTIRLDNFLLRLGEQKIEFQPEEFRVVGIFSSGFLFGDLQILVPYNTFRRTFGSYLPDVPYSNAFVLVNSAENVVPVEQELKSLFGDSADVISGQVLARIAAQALGSIRSGSSIAAILAAVIGALVILFTSVLTTRQRTKEIGILKAIGASNGDIAKDFIVESFSVGIAASFLGLFVFVFGGPTIAFMFLSPIAPAIPGFGTGHEGVTELLLAFFSFGFSNQIIFISLGLSIIFGGIGSLYAVRRAVKLNPADALRYE